MTWLLTSRPGTYDRTTANRFAHLASCGNDAPNVMPLSDVATSPVTVRILSGTFILGSNVSSCDGPPNMYRKITDLPVVIGFFPPASAEEPSRCGSDRPPRPSEPMRRNSRREKPGRPSKRESITASLCRRNRSIILLCSESRIALQFSRKRTAKEFAWPMEMLFAWANNPSMAAYGYTAWPSEIKQRDWPSFSGASFACPASEHSNPT